MKENIIFLHFLHLILNKLILYIILIFYKYKYSYEKYLLLK